MRDFRINELLRVVKEIEDWCKDIDVPRLKKNDPRVQEGLRQSANVCAQEKVVFTTPIMKNLLVVFGDVKQYQDETTGEWKTDKLPCGASSKAVEWVNQVVSACLLKYNGPEKHEYNTNLNIFDPEHYNVDCYNGWKPEIWDIQPGQAEERAKTLKEYTIPKTNYGYDQLLRDLANDQALQLACILWLAYYPEVRASKQVTDFTDPFMNKKSGVSWPEFRNDSTVVPDQDYTYGKMCVEDIKKIWAQFYKNPEKVTKYILQYLVYTAYPRNQRGKGRALEAMSRRYNILINIINGPEMEAFKALNYGTGLKSEEGVKADLIQIGEFCESLGSEYAPFNMDATKWDLNLGYGLAVLQNGLRLMKTNGSSGKYLVKMRNLGIRKAPLIDGPNNSCDYIYGRTESGYVDTTLQNTNGNRVVSLAGACSTQPDYASKVYYPSKGQCIITLGDDLLAVIKKDKKKQFCEYMANKGIKLHNDEKDAYGLFFIQYRLCRSKDGKYWMAYNWPRVLRSMLSKENQKSLGEAGWTLAMYQQIAKCRENRDSVTILVNIAAACDKTHLHLNTPISKLIEMCNAEDEAKRATQTSRRKDALTTAEKLSGGNPQALGIADGKLNANFFEEVQKLYREVYNPHFLESIGFATPDISKVH